jgi:hypothetical protein
MRLFLKGVVYDVHQTRAPAGRGLCTTSTSQVDRPPGDVDVEYSVYRCYSYSGVGYACM